MASAPNPEPVAAMLRVPENLWKEIFEWGVTMDGGTAPREITQNFTDGTRDAVMNHPWLFPWNVSFVCPEWREMAVSMPSLWSQVYITVPTRVAIYPDRTSMMVRDLQLIFERSKRMPLHMDVSSLVRLPSDNVWATLMGKKGRCESLNLLCRPDKDLYKLALTKHQWGRWSSLTSLVMELESSHSVDVPSEINLQGLTQLRSYEERGSWKSQTSILLPLASLLSITLYLPFGFVGARLGPAPLLQQLVVEAEQCPSWLSTNTLGITSEYYVKRQKYWPCLTHLTVKNCPFLLRFAEGAPVQHLYLQVDCDDVSLQSLAPLLSEASSSIQVLSLKGGLAWTDELVRQNIRNLRNVNEICITLCMSTDDTWSCIDARLPDSLWAAGLMVFLRELVVSGSSVPCPNLSVLEVDLVWQGDVSQPTWRWLRDESKGFVDTVGSAMGVVWESRLKGNGKPCRPLENCCLTTFAGGEPQSYSDVRLLQM